MCDCGSTRVGVGQLTTGGLPRVNWLFQRRTFLRNQRYTILFHQSAPSRDVHPQTDAFTKQELALPVNWKLTDRQARTLCRGFSDGLVGI
jgi:hypothetical protein